MLDDFNENNTDLIGKVFKKFTIESFSHKTETGILKWNCICKCRKITKVRGTSLTANRTKSCGCLKYATIEGLKHRILVRYKRGAQRRNLILELSKEQFYNIIEQNCYYCDSEPNNKFKMNRKEVKKKNPLVFTYSGIDRKDNGIGYTLNNLVPCCIICNKAKASQKLKEFTEWVEKTYKNLKKRNEL